jgi:hypothetical protein
MRCTEYETVTEVIELICTMTGFRRRFPVPYLGRGFFRSAELGPSQHKRKQASDELSKRCNVRSSKFCTRGGDCCAL